jgi:hypothetical protein
LAKPRKDLSSSYPVTTARELLPIGQVIAQQMTKKKATRSGPKNKGENVMNYFAKGVLTATTLAALVVLPIVGQAGQAPSSTQRWYKDKDPEPEVCDNRAPRVRGVKLAAPITNTVDFSGTNGAFDPVPLLETQIYVGGKKHSCVIAHFSAEFNTGDNLIIFQASIDDDPMDGHTLFPEEFREPLPPITTPIVFDKSSVSPSGNKIPAMTAYNFYKIVKPGWYKVKIKWAGCCSTNPASVSAEVLAAVLTLEYQGKLANYEHDDD